MDKNSDGTPKKSVIDIFRQKVLNKNDKNYKCNKSKEKTRTPIKRDNSVNSSYITINSNILHKSYLILLKYTKFS